MRNRSSIIAVTSLEGLGSCTFHTTIGTEHDSHSATQQTSSSNHHVVIRAASHNSQFDADIAATVGRVTDRGHRDAVGVRESGAHIGSPISRPAVVRAEHTDFGVPAPHLDAIGDVFDYASIADRTSAT